MKAGCCSVKSIQKAIGSLGDRKVDRLALFEQPPSVAWPNDYILIGASGLDGDCLFTRLLPREDEIASCLCSARGKLVKNNVHDVVTGLNIPHDALLSGDAILPYCVPSARFARHFPNRVYCK